MDKFCACILCRICSKFSNYYLRVYQRFVLTFVLTRLEWNVRIPELEKIRKLECFDSNPENTTRGVCMVLLYIVLIHTLHTPHSTLSGRSHLHVHIHASKESRCISSLRLCDLWCASFTPQTAGKILKIWICAFSDTAEWVGLVWSGVGKNKGGCSGVE